MAGDWIKMRGNLWDDPRVSRLCDLTGKKEAEVIGALYWLWASADQHTENGLMPGLTQKGIDRKTGVDGIGKALVEIGWISELDSGITIERFSEHNGESAKKRSLDAKRKAGFREMSANSRTKRGQNADNLRTECGQKAPNDGQNADEKRRIAELEKEKEKSKHKKPVRAAPDPAEALADQETCRSVWESYARSYSARYGADPVRNATVNSEIKRFIERLPSAEAPDVAAFYVTHNDPFYVKQCHPVGLLLAQAEKLRMEWATAGKQPTLAAVGPDGKVDWQEWARRKTLQSYA